MTSIKLPQVAANLIGSGHVDVIVACDDPSSPSDPYDIEEVGWRRVGRMVGSVGLVGRLVGRLVGW